MTKRQWLSILILLTLLLTGCAYTPSTDSASLQVVCTGFAPFDWVKNIVGQSRDVQVTLMADNNADLHNYQATVADLALMADCDLLIYVGGTSDQWVADGLKNPRNPERRVLALTDFVEKELAHDGHQHSHPDEHVWLSLNYAAKAVAHIALLLGELNPENQAVYAQNAAAYQKQLTELDGRYRACVERSDRKTLVFGDRFPFGYWADDYGLTCYAPFEGCSTETEASFSTVVSLAQRLDQEQLSSIMVIESSDEVIARAVIENTAQKNQQIRILDSIQAGAQKRAAAGDTYLAIMEKNLTVLTQALQ